MASSESRQVLWGALFFFVSLTYFAALLLFGSITLSEWSASAKLLCSIGIPSALALWIVCSRSVVSVSVTALTVIAAFFAVVAKGGVAGVNVATLVLFAVIVLVSIQVIRALRSIEK